MKIRIKGASVRLRLSKTEVARIVHEGRVEEATPFGESVFRYALQNTAGGEVLSASFEGGAITMYVPQALLENWDTDSRISIAAQMPLEGGGSLQLLLEKDFQCIDATGEDQSDNYINPNTAC